MKPFGRSPRCVRCGSRHEVRVVTYVRRQEGERKLTEPWCRQCRHQKLRRQS